MPRQIGIVNEYGEGYGGGGGGHMGEKIDETKTEPITAQPEPITSVQEATPVATAEEKAKQEQQELWNREDAIRKETQEREDTAYQRLIKDMQKAGINPNLQFGTPSTGGGITNATPKNLDRIEKEKDRLLELLKQELENAFKGEQNAYDRAVKVMGQITKLL